MTRSIAPETRVYPGDPKVTVERIASIESCGYSVSKLEMGSHTATHIDAPAHILEGGATVDEVDLSSLVGRAYLIDLSGKNEIGNDEIEKAFPFKEKGRCEIVLLKTESSDQNFARILPDTAEWIAKKGYLTVGIDSESVDSGEELDNHMILLGKGINIIENLDLKNVEPGYYGFVCLPLKIKECDGAPARAILLQS
ncbi:cyclase family protein [Methanohalophilus halophilus]|uniref:cyclase family protein n=1 Tax=Methanohalophilus halophilus TaxID=2177 RepID=UPI0022866497|nr:cyclase family protein [Methanohalophilus halophilus]